MIGDDICSICLNNFNINTITTPCNHKFCFYCFTNHLTSNNVFSRKCPICRNSLIENDNGIINNNHGIQRGITPLTISVDPNIYNHYRENQIENLNNNELRSGLINIIRRRLTHGPHWWRNN